MRRARRSPCATRAPCRSTRYQAKLAQFLRNFCHRDEASGWTRDKRVRDTGPFIGTLNNGKWTGTYFGTHAPVVTWYSPDMVEWLKSNRAEEHAVPLQPEPVPDGAIMVKEMFPPPAAACASVDPLHLAPTSGAAVMVRDAGGSYDGWYWGWFGWGEKDWRPDWPAPAANDYPYMGYGLYCMNCHGSARDNATFASLRNIKGERGDPLVFLSQTFIGSALFESFHEAIAKAKPESGAAARAALPFAVHALLPAAEQGAADERDRRQHAVGNLRPCLGAGGPAERAHRRW